MPQVIADNEVVNFQEGIPEKPIHIYELLMGAFAEQKRSVVKFSVDGVDCMQSGNFPESFECIKAESLSHDEITLRLSIELLNSVSNLKEDIQAYQANILITSWSVVFKQMDQFIAKIQPFADLIDHVLPYAQAYSPHWRSSFEENVQEQASILEKILYSFQNHDPAGLSNELALRFLPLYQKVITLFTKQIIPDLQESVGVLDSVPKPNA
jgi:hypothetical protein